MFDSKSYNIFILFKLNIILVLITCVNSCNQKEANKSNKKNTPSISNQKSIKRFSSLTVLDTLINGVKDVGTIKFKSDTSFTFHLKCNSRDSLIIYKLETGCACTTTETQTPKTVKPDEILGIKVRYNTNIKGSFIQDILVFNNSNTNPIIITIKGIVK
ncbi:DUF1573 domain-containing protein [Pedobacter sp. Hv1]|uniref:DUF1573 domain-containing protein n=1 Tax=Pedobacter sp. Hv1 TaxID=1740090 RepID=UPI0006D8CE9C|nr:DUF1573 domain-containing protein [Pedobacter sp. Hv1]KQB99423.1 hypothetical protein AQF98_17795 [Pedobacter sp. Hv1]